MRLGFQTQKEEKLGHGICWGSVESCCPHYIHQLFITPQEASYFFWSVFMSTPGWPLSTEQTSATDANEGSHTGTKTCLSPSSRPTVPSWVTRPEAHRLGRLHNAENHPLAGGLHAFSLTHIHTHNTPWTTLTAPHWPPTKIHDL